MNGRVFGAVLVTIALLAGCGQASPPGTSASGGLSAQSVGPGEKFPAGFLWGVATAGFQSEGGDTNNNWYASEQEGRFKEPIKDAVDFWNRYPSDMDLAKGMGLDAFRMSIEWSRVEPLPGVWDQAALDHYGAMIDAAIARGLDPVITLNHFTYPAWLDATNGPKGWDRPDAPDLFAQYVYKVATAFKGKVHTWLTLNEPNALAIGGFLTGQIPPWQTGPENYDDAIKGMIAAHELAYRTLHMVDPTNQVSTNLFYYYFGNGVTYDPTALWADGPPTVQSLSGILHDFTGLPGPRLSDFDPQTLDFIAIDFYWGISVQGLLNIREAYNWPQSPPDLEKACESLYAQYHKPILIAENGMATRNLAPRADGWTREASLVNHLYYLHQAIAHGVPVMGYMYWSLTDNYEWGDWTPRFGLYSVDGLNDPSLTRVPTAAVAVYRQIATSNSLPDSLLSQYMVSGTPSN